MKKLKQVNWIKCEDDFELVEQMLTKCKYFVCRDHFYFNDQQHQIADIKRTLKNHNDWKNKINCYYSCNSYYMVIFKKDSIEVVYYESENNKYNSKITGLVFLDKYRRSYKGKPFQQAKLGDIVFTDDTIIDPDIEIF